MGEAHTPKIAAAYIRVSTDEQAEQSPESQLVEIRKFAGRSGYILPDEYIYLDEGISGKHSQNRPAFQKMIGTAKEKPAPFEVILLWKFSRFARNQEESIVYKALLRKQCGVDVVSVSEPLPGGQFSSLIERIIEWFDEFYSIRLSQEVKRTMSVKASRGEFQSSPAFGYRAHMEPGKKTVLEPVPEEAEIVREMFGRFVSGDGCYTIARWLNTQGVTTHRGSRFENRTVEYILRNPVYIGKLRWTPTGRTRRDFDNPDTIVADGEHEPIVALEVFEAAQKRMGQIKAQWGYKARPTYELKDWLGGVVRCADCGTTLVFAKPHYFKCNNYAKGRCRSSQHVPVEVLHREVLTRLEQDMESGRPLTYTVVHTNRNGGGEISRLKSTLADYRRRSDRLLEAYLGGVMELDAYAAMKSGLDESILQAQTRLDELKRLYTPENSEQLLRDSIRQALDTLTAADSSLEEKNNALRGVVERIDFSKSAASLNITYRVIF